MSISAEWLTSCCYCRETTANATLSDSFDIEKELALYAKDADIPHLKIELQMLPDLVKTYNESNHKTFVSLQIFTPLQIS